ncbi:MAG: SIMPL domain-containing protein [Pseudomonadota bacterium]|nr:SIMPL domain-containing protein [Pseudomonadota bacterium]
MTRCLTRLHHTVLAAALLAPGLALAQAQPTTPTAMLTLAQPQNVLQLSATGEVEVLQDLLSLTLTATREGTDAAAVQAELRRAVDAALAAVKPAAEPGQMDVKTGDFSVHPRYNRDGKITGWQGRTSVVLEGRDFPRITQAAARAAPMTIGDIAFNLSREQRATVEAQAQAQAIERFQARASEIAKAFGFAGYTLREVNVSSDGGGYAGPAMAMAKSGRSSMADSAPVSVEPGLTQVRVVVSGAVVAH